MTDRRSRPPVAMFSPDARHRTWGKIAEAELREAFRIRSCGRLDEFCEVLKKTHLGVIVGERRSETAVVEGVAAPASDGPPALVMVIDGTRTEEGAGSDGAEPVPVSHAKLMYARLHTWQMPGSLLPTTTGALIGNVLDRCQHAVLCDRDLAARHPILQRALVRVFERTERPVAEVQALARSLQDPSSGVVRSLQMGWAIREGSSEMSLKELLKVVDLLRALLLRLQQRQLSWSDVALESGVTLRTLRRYLKRYAGVTPSGLKLVEMPALVLELGRRVSQAVR